MSCVDTKDFIFLIAKDLVESRHAICQYSPTEDIFKLVDTVFYYSYLSCEECIISKTIPSGADFGIPGLSSALKNSVIIYNYYMMIVTINECVGIKFIDCTKDIIFSLVSISFDILKESLKISKYTSHSLEKKNINLNNILLSWLFCGNVYANTVAFGWIYMRVLERFVKKRKTELSSEEIKCAVKEVLRSDTATINVIVEKNRNLFVNKFNYSFDNDKCSYDYIYSDLLRYLDEYNDFLKYKIRIELDEYVKVLKSCEITIDSNALCFNSKISQLLYKIANTNELVTPTFIYNTVADFNNFLMYYIPDLLWYVSQQSPIHNVREVCRVYMKYVTGKNNSPSSIWISKYNESLIGMSYIQCVGAAVNTYLLVNKRKPVYDSILVSELYTVWSHMLVEIIYNMKNNDVETKIQEFLPVLVSFILFKFTDSNLYSFDNIYRSRQICSNRVQHIDEILKYLPSYYMSLKQDSMMDKDLYADLVNATLTYYIGNTLFDIIHDAYSPLSWLDKLISVNIDEEIVKPLLLFERNMICK